MTDCKPWPWDPIATAPRDGKVILARQGGYFPVAMFWRDGKWLDVLHEVEQVPTHWKPRDLGENVPAYDEPMRCRWCDKVHGGGPENCTAT